MFHLRSILRARAAILYCWMNVFFHIGPKETMSHGSCIICSLGCLAEVRQWRKYSIQAYNATGMYFGSAPVHWSLLYTNTVAVMWKNEAGKATVWAAFWHSRSESCAFRILWIDQFSSGAICVDVLWTMAAFLGSALFSVSMVQSPCWQIHNKSKFPSWSSLSFPPQCLNNDTIIYDKSSSNLGVNVPHVSSGDNGLPAWFFVPGVWMTSMHIGINRVANAPIRRERKIRVHFNESWSVLKYLWTSKQECDNKPAQSTAKNSGCVIVWFCFTGLSILDQELSGFSDLSRSPGLKTQPICLLHPSF